MYNHTHNDKFKMKNLRNKKVSSPWGECSTFSAAVAIHTVPIFVPPGTHFCCVVDGGGVASKLAHDCHCGNRTPDP